MSDYYHAKHFELRPMIYRSGQKASNENVSAGTSDFIEPATVGNDVQHDRVISSVNENQQLLNDLGIAAFHLITFYAFARKNGYEHTKLVGMADNNTYSMFLNNRIEVTPDNLWFKDRGHAIIVAAALSELYENL